MMKFLSKLVVFDPFSIDFCVQAPARQSGPAAVGGSACDAGHVKIPGVFRSSGKARDLRKASKASEKH